MVRNNPNNASLIMFDKFIPCMFIFNAPQWNFINDVPHIMLFVLTHIGELYAIL